MFSKVFPSSFELLDTLLVYTRAHVRAVARCNVNSCSACRRSVRSLCLNLPQPFIKIIDYQYVWDTSTGGGEEKTKKNIYTRSGRNGRVRMYVRIARSNARTAIVLFPQYLHHTFAPPFFASLFRLSATKTAVTKVRTNNKNSRKAAPVFQDAPFCAPPRSPLVSR